MTKAENPGAGSAVRLDQPALAEVAEVAAAGALDHVDGELEKANFPGVVHALNYRAERIFAMLNVRLCALDHRLDRVAKRFFGDIGFAKLRAITQYRHVVKTFAKLIGIALRFVAETFEQQP